MNIYRQLVELVRGDTTPVRMRTRARMAGSALIRRDDNLVYADNTPTPQVWISTGCQQARDIIQ